MIPLRVREINISKYEISKYITEDIYLSGVNNQGRKILTYLRRELYIIDDLRIKMLIRNNIIKSKGIVINIINKKARINSYKTTINITIRPRDEFIRRKIFIKLSTFVPPRSEIILLIKEINLSNDRNFLFELVV